MDGNAIEKVAEELESQNLEERFPENKPTQTDHVNKKLLDSFLERLNQNDNSVAFAFNNNSNTSQSAFDEADFVSGDEKDSKCNDPVSSKN